MDDINILIRNKLKERNIEIIGVSEYRSDFYF